MLIYQRVCWAVGKSSVNTSSKGCEAGGIQGDGSSGAVVKDRDGEPGPGHFSIFVGARMKRIHVKPGLNQALQGETASTKPSYQLVDSGFIVGIIIQTHHKNQPSFHNCTNALFNFSNRVHWFYQVLPGFINWKKIRTGLHH